jgi:hypothetical protein
MYVYGDRRDYGSIDIYVNGKYRCTTTWSRNLTEARQRFLDAYPEEVSQVVSASYADNEPSKNGLRKRLQMWI